MNFSEILVIAALGALAWFWLDSLGAREAGMAAVRTACAEDGLQLLDETVAGKRLSLARDDHGQLRWRRVFVFEYSDTGNDRRQGSISLLGREVEYLHLRPHLYVIPNSHETEH
ncbi:MAG: DUF3301 domain-containing protein [Azonexus sp.]|nr:DUF3301 domain-containing protein [Azonexus sp.]